MLNPTQGGAFTGLADQARAQRDVGHVDSSVCEWALRQFRRPVVHSLNPLHVGPSDSFFVLVATGARTFKIVDEWLIGAVRDFIGHRTVLASDSAAVGAPASEPAQPIDPPPPAARGSKRTVTGRKRTVVQLLVEWEPFIVGRDYSATWEPMCGFEEHWQPLIDTYFAELRALHVLSADAELPAHGSLRAPLQRARAESKDEREKRRKSARAALLVCEAKRTAVEHLPQKRQRGASTVPAVGLGGWPMSQTWEPKVGHELENDMGELMERG
ncbi:hypothetical protein T492DRAFT_507409 [Pavlovales sp. CCMP2436]|nr:hypothetical protein T492DRAFT_507409 [Pavlovales sp. CCMP2436]